MPHIENVEPIKRAKCRMFYAGYRVSYSQVNLRLSSKLDACPEEVLKDKVPRKPPSFACLPGVCW